MQSVFFFFAFLISAVGSFSAFASQVVIVIDDIGWRYTDAKALTLPGNITYSVLPHTPFGKKLALEANANDHDVLLHIPMESTIGKKLGPGALTSDMNEATIRQQLQNAFSEIPFAVGINNHMGSKLTQLYTPMAWTMRYLKQRNVMFLDSMTTQQSKAKHVAELFGVPSLHRHVFLDNQLTEQYITQQFKQLIEIAEQHQQAVAIAHPHPETIATLTKLIPTLEEHGIELVAISELLTPKPVQLKTAQVSKPQLAK